ncbi:MAG: choice-of-anchor Q domain-containing protein [Planctomycetota bacterium]
MPINKWLRIFSVCVLAALVVLSASCSKKKTKPKTVAPTITSTAPATAVVGTLYSYSIIATVNPAPSLSVTGIPVWLTFDGVDLISGTPTAGDIGLSETMTITASNGVTPDAVQTFSISVNPAPVAPMITSTAPTTATAESVYSYLIIATGIPTPTLSVTNLPAWLSFDGTDTITGTPTTGDIGLSETITITASNGVAPDVEQTFSIIVSPAPAAPMITSTAPTTVTVGSLFSNEITATGYPVPSLSVTGLPAWLSFDGTDTISGTPSIDEIGLSNTIIITAVNGILPNASQTFVIIVRPQIVYVKADATGANDGSSWNNAFVDLQDSLSLTVTNYDIWVASGTYVPTVPNGDRNISFLMKDDVNLYGGFNGTETMLDQRDWETNVSILSGDLNGNDIGFTNNGENSYTVVTGCNNVTLDGFTITGGNSNSASIYGGGMYNFIVSPIVKNCIFSGNSASHGGGIYNAQSTATFTNVSFILNSVSGNGGGIYNYMSPITLINCTFSMNSAGGDGGGMKNSSSSSILRNCTFEGNTASSNGGGLQNNNSALQLTNCTFSVNSANVGGGGMHNSIDTFSLTPSITPVLNNCIFNENSAGDGGGMFNARYSTYSLSSCTFTLNTASTNGGGIYNFYSSSTISNSAFAGNAATNSGGGVFNYSSAPTLMNCILCANTATNGGGINNVNSSSSILTNCTIRGNTANASGGGFYNSESSPMITNSILWDNNAITSGNELYNADLITNYISFSSVKGCGGSGASWNATLGIDGGGNNNANPMFIDASDPAGPDGIFRTTDDGLNLQSTSPCVDAAHSVPAPQTDITGRSRVDILSIVNTGSGYATFFDIGAYEYNGSTGYTIAGEFTGDVVPNLLLEISSTSVTIGSVMSAASGCFEFSAIPDGEYTITPVPVPGCVFTPSNRTVTVSNADIRNVNFVVTVLVSAQPVIYVNMTASGLNDGTSWANAFTEMRFAVRHSASGQEIWVAKGQYCPAEFYPWNRSISFVLKQGVSWYGGFSGGEAMKDQRDWSFNPTTLSGDLKGNDVGFSNNKENSLNVLSSRGISNTTIDGFVIRGGNGMYGGGMFNNGSTPTIKDCAFIWNSVGISGGGIYNASSSPRLTNCTFSWNSAFDGGAIFNDYPSSSPTLTSCVFRKNITSYNGGGIYFNNNGSILMNCVFDRNSAGGSGGAIYTNNGIISTFSNCVFSGNTSNSNGGGIYNFYSNITLKNCSFCGNMSINYGGAIYNVSSPQLKNCILWGSNATSGYEIYNLVITNKPIISYSDIKGCGGSGGSWVSSIGTDSGNNIDLDPLFVHAPISTRKTTSNGTTTTIIISSASSYFSIADVIEIKNDGIVRTVSSVATDTITFTPALSAASVSNTIVHNWGPGATDLEFNLQLQPSSPCIDAGTSTGAPATDILGVERPQGLEVDMGAYEQ